MYFDEPSVISIPMLSVHPDRVNIYNDSVRLKPRKWPRPEKVKMPISKFHNNKVSDQARRKVVKAIDYLVFLATDKKLPATAHGRNLNFKISFITLTLSSEQKHSDNEIKEKLLNHFFIEAKKKWNVKNYLWKAEKQVNGNIHFHILSDKFIHWNELRNVWNRIQNKLGYVDAYRAQMLEFHKGGFKVREDLLKRWEYKKQINAYREGSRQDWMNPNSTDIHSLRFISNTKAYVMKYVTKEQKDHDIKGRLWGCNYELTDLPGGRTVVDLKIEKEMRSAFRKFKPKFYKGDHFTVIYITPQQLEASGAVNIIREFAGFLLEKFNYNYSFDIPGG